MKDLIIIHEQTKAYIYPVDMHRLAIRLKVNRSSGKSYSLFYWNRQKGSMYKPMTSKMKCYARDEQFDYYETVIKTIDITKYISYYFKINTNKEARYFCYYGLSNKVPEEGFFQYDITNENDIFRAPKWVKHSIFYQIFPERFFNGDLKNDPHNVKSWGSVPTRENFMGGDLKGIEKKLDYIYALGVSAIYINPIFEASFNHKYATIDYFKIDSQFGTIKDLKILVQKCHSKGIRVILDGVFNHCGYYFKPFQDVLANGKNSPYKDWFIINEMPIDSGKINYECVGYYKWMPKLNLANKDVRNYILGVATYWIEEVNIDGWRLDVADEIDHTFWHEFRRKIKADHPECFILAETWREHREMLYGDQMDSVMNYVFRDAIVDFFAKEGINSFDFDCRINKFLGNYISPVHTFLFNLIDSHDTERFLTASQGNIEKLKIASAFQLCFIGVPCIYYGDEIGMMGENDPGCRGCMEWNKVEYNLEILNWYKNLINIRNSYPILVEGTFCSNYCSKSNNVYGFFREYENQRIYIVINNSSKSTFIDLPLKESINSKNYLLDVISGHSYKLAGLKKNNYYNQDINSYKSSISMNLNPYQVCILI